MIPQYSYITLSITHDGHSRYMVCINLGESLREDPDINNIHDQTNMIISVTNDLFSLRRELQFPFYNNV